MNLFKNLDLKNVLGMNRRNLEFVYPNNKRKYFDYANDKLLTKKTLSKAKLNIPETFFTVSYFYELNNLEDELKKHKNFVIKPASGSGGNGIIVISGYSDGMWISISSKKYSFEKIKKHIADIIFGVYSFGLSDTAIIEERIFQHKTITHLSPQGLADIRMINYKGINVKAMLRIATKESDGKANLHQGGIGVAIDIKKGNTFLAQIDGSDVTHHPDTDICLIDVSIPFWKDICTLCEETASLIPMGYLGIDIALSENGPVVLEVNARPGIEIQNVSDEGMLGLLHEIDRKLNL